MPRNTRQDTILKLEQTINHLEIAKQYLFQMGLKYQDANASIPGIALVNMDMIDEVVRLCKQGIAELKGA